MYTEKHRWFRNIYINLPNDNSVIRNQDKQHSFQQIILRSLALQLEKKRKFDSYFIPYTKTNCKCIKQFINCHKHRHPGEI